MRSSLIREHAPENISAFGHAHHLLWARGERRTFLHLSVPGGQYEAALALNMPASTRMRRIVLPQAMINARPPATNLMIELLKGTSLVSLITLSDLTFRARQLDEATSDR